jgi:hypothetical protein
MFGVGPLFGSPLVRYRLSATLLFWLASFLVSPVALCEQSAQGHRVLTQLSVVGDDQLTQKFASALNEEMASSGHFILDGNGDWTIQMTIPGHLYWQAAGSRTNFQYIVIFTDHQSRYLGVSLGPCWADEMRVCAKKVLTDARNALAH